ESDSIPVNLGSAGGPQVWDFTTGGTSLITSDIYLDPAQSPPQYSRANIVIQTDQLNIGGISEPGKMYNFLSRNRYLIGALETTYEGETVDFALTPPLTQMVLPLNYGDSWSNTLNLDEQFTFPSGDIRIELTANMNSQVDAYGTAQVPYGEFDALRIRSDVHYDLTVSIWLLFFWYPILEQVGDAVDYNWHAENTGLVLNVMAQGTNPNFTIANSVRRLMNTADLAGDELTKLSDPNKPNTFEIEGAYPNPFNSETVIAYDLSEESQVYLSVFDIMGRQVAAFDEGLQTMGTHQVHWSPEGLSAGVYYVQLKAGKQTQVTPVVYMK
ncbi:T9SS type A sorting domain-containing protein, partial [bacterium]|nr:T9SS type A sorting domain-containing protein [bacterium]